MLDSILEAAHSKSFKRRSDYQYYTNTKDQNHYETGLKFCYLLPKVFSL